MTVILFAGKKGSGKNTAARILRENVIPESRSVLEMAFADRLKDTCKSVFGLTHVQCYGPPEAKKGKTEVPRALFGDAVPKGDEFLTVREVLQYVGTEVFRSAMPDVWAWTVVQRIAESSADYVLVTDCRFPNEITYVRKHYPSAKAVWVLRDDVAWDDRHPSEVSLDAEVTKATFGKPSLIDDILDNSGDMEHLEENLVKLAEKYDIPH